MTRDEIDAQLTEAQAIIQRVHDATTPQAAMVREDLRKAYGALAEAKYELKFLDMLRQEMQP